MSIRFISLSQFILDHMYLNSQHIKLLQQTMSGPITVRPTLPGGAGAPYPFNSNDALVWKALICKYLCKYKIEIFNESGFYETFLSGKLEQGGAYLGPLRSASVDDRKSFDRLLRFCLDSLCEIGLLNKTVKNSTEVVYTKTARLDIFCPDMLRYDMFDVNLMVEPLLKAEEGVLSDTNFREIIAMLESLRKVNAASLEKARALNAVELADAIQRVDPSTIHKLNQLGLILRALNGNLTISSIGKKVLSDMKYITGK